MLLRQLVDALHVRLGAFPWAKRSLALVRRERDAVSLELLVDVLQALQELRLFLGAEELIANLVFHLNLHVFASETERRDVRWHAASTLGLSLLRSLRAPPGLARVESGGSDDFRGST